MSPHAHSCGRDPIAPAYLGSMRQQSGGGRARHSPLLAFVAALRAAELVGRPLGPPAFLDLARGARRPRSAAGEARRQAAARGTGRGPDCEALMVIPHVSSCESRDLHDGSAKWTYRASSAVWTANFLSFPFISFSESSFFKGLQQKLATPLPLPSCAPVGEGKPSIIRGRRAEFDLCHDTQGNMNCGILEEVVRVMFLRPTSEAVDAGLRER